MAHTFIDSTETETPADRVLGTAWAGTYQLLCTVYTSAAVVLQVREPGGTWLNASFDGTPIELKSAGAVLDISLVRDFEYRLQTATAGAEVLIAKHNIYD